MNSPEDAEMSASLSEDSEMSSAEDYEMSGYGDFESGISEDFAMSVPKDAKLQCGYFQWADEPLLADDRHAKELNVVGFQCTQLQERLDEIEREKSDLMTKLSAVQAELDDIKKKTEIADESKLMQPLDEFSNTAADKVR